MQLAHLWCNCVATAQSSVIHCFDTSRIAPAALFLYRLESMVDIHCHILPGLDDGAKTMEVSVQMAESAIADGITHVIGTPHSNAEYVFRPDLILERRNELQARVEGRLQ